MAAQDDCRANDGQSRPIDTQRVNHPRDGRTDQEQGRYLLKAGQHDVQCSEDHRSARGRPSFYRTEMVASKAQQIHDELHRVTAERSRRERDPELGRKVILLKAYQQKRFSKTHANLLIDPRHQSAARFFLEHLYGPEDFSTRDDQFARVIPAMVRLFPDEVVNTVAKLASLHAISERLDTSMSGHLSEPLNQKSYAAAWQATGHPELRNQQIELSLQIGESLDRLTRNPIIRHSLRMMRGPAKAAGLSELQRFLETGFEAFRRMRGAKDFLESIKAKERHLVEVLNVATPPFESSELQDQLP